LSKNSRRDPWVLGISASHNGAVCLLKGERIVVAIQEERLLGVKRARLAAATESLALNYALTYAGIKPADIDVAVVCAQTNLSAPVNQVELNEMLDVKGNGIPVYRLSHHAGHAVSAFATSGFAEADILVLDGMGSPYEDFSEDEKAAVVEDVPNGSETASLYHASGTTIRALEKHLAADGQWLGAPPQGSSMPSFDGLGGMYSAVAWQVFGDSMEAGKVMGLAPYGEPVYPSSEFFEIHNGVFSYPNRIHRRYTKGEHWPKDQAEYCNLSSSVQVALEEALMYFAGHLKSLQPSDNLAYAGGVALNSVGNEKIIRESGFKNVYIVPPAEDSGAAIGAAYYGLWKHTGRNTRVALTKDAFGCEYTPEQINEAIARVPAITASAEADPIDAAVDLLADGKIVGWFDGRSELGPRALGQRSILCDPRSPDAKDVLNGRVKHREAFRPFAPVILEEEVGEWFDVAGVDPSSPFMLRVYPFREDKKELVPGVVHADGTGRVQTVSKEINGRYYAIVKSFFSKTGVPILLNTSLNVMGEPIVETPEDALWSLLMTGMDACVFPERIVTKSDAGKSVLDMYPYRIVPAAAVSKTMVEGARRLTFDVSTPWGGHSFSMMHPLPVELAAYLLDNLIDGATSVSKILGTVSTVDSAVTEHMLIIILAQLRRTRVISFSDSPT